jgi:hypothetical protein
LLKYIAALGLGVLILGAGDCWAGWGDPPPGAPCGAPPGPPVVVGSSPCDCCPRPGLFARIRERRQARACARASCSSCPAPRPGLFQRIRERANQRRGYFVPACQ